jgi:hypothetical protein
MIDHRPPEWPCGDRFYGAAEYLFFWVRQPQAPALLVIGPTDNPTTVIGNNKLGFDNGERTGARFSFGVWLDDCQTVGLEATYMFWFQRHPQLTVNPGGNDFVTVPFNDTTGSSSGLPIVVPGSQSGGSSITTFSRMWSIEGNLRKELCRFDGGHLDLLAGFRCFELDESIALDNTIQIPLVPVFLSGATINTHDFFGTGNRFLAGQLGLDGQIQVGRVFVDMWGKFALGDVREKVYINGSTLVVTPPVPAVGNITSAGGILALPTNSGVFQRNQLAFMPEAGVKVGFRLTDWLRVSAGYSFLYINRVARPGDQIDTTVNPTQIPALSPGPLVGPARPAFQFNSTDFWAHALMVELEYRF